MSLPRHIMFVSDSMCDFDENKSYVCIACNSPYLDYKKHIKTLKHRRNAFTYDYNEKKAMEKANKMEIDT
jgi:hypothetical protein